MTEFMKTVIQNDIPVGVYSGYELRLRRYSPHASVLAMAFTEDALRCPNLIIDTSCCTLRIVLSSFTLLDEERRKKAEKLVRSWNGTQVSTDTVQFQTIDDLLQGVDVFLEFLGTF